MSRSVMNRFFTLACIVIFSSNAHAKLTFSSTQKWHPEKLEAANAKSHVFSEEELSAFQLPPFPTPTSPEGIAELQSLVSDKKLRTLERVRLIRMERKASISFGPMDLSDMSNEHPIVKFSAFVMGASVQPIFRIKKQYDRVRPHLLNTDIDPIIIVPGHPAYPSGHAAQYHILALGLADIAPEYKDLFMQKAHEISRHREIAGVHYPSDSSAGKVLALQIHEKLKTKDAYRDLLKQASKSWKKEKKYWVKNWERAKNYELPLQN